MTSWKQEAVQHHFQLTWILNRTFVFIFG